MLKIQYYVKAKAHYFGDNFGQKGSGVYIHKKCEAIKKFSHILKPHPTESLIPKLHLGHVHEISHAQHMGHHS